MDDTVIVLSSDDETTANVQVKNERVCSKVANDLGDTEMCVPNKKPKLTSGEETNADGVLSVDTALPQPGSPESSVFTDFVTTCYRLDNSSSMHKIVDTKLRKYYSLLVPEYRRSEQFYSLMERKEAEMVRCPSHLFRHMKELLDELKSHRSDKSEKVKVKASDKFVHKLCKALELLHRKIKKLEEKEVDWDDDNNSSYIQLQRYRERMIKVHEKLQELEGETRTRFRRKISFSGTQFPSINRAIEKFVNAKGEFPDYYDIYDLLKKTYMSERIEISTDKLKSEAKLVFINIGEQLQKQRQLDCWDAHSSFLPGDADPADFSSELCSALNENRKLYGSRVDEIIDQFAAKSSKSQSASEDGSSSSETNQRKDPLKLENEPDKDEKSVKRRKHDMEMKKEEDPYNKCDEEEYDEGGGGSDDYDDEDDDDDNEDDEDEANNETETVEDILNDIGEDPPVDNYKEDLFVYCGPVSPPTSSDHVLDVDSSPSMPSPGCGIDSINISGDIGQLDVSNGFSDTNETKDEPTAGCSRWEDVEGVENWVSRKLREYENSKADLKLKDTPSLSTKSSVNDDPEEILLD